MAWPPGGMSTRRSPGARWSRSPPACAGTGSPGCPAGCPAATDDLATRPAHPPGPMPGGHARPAGPHKGADDMSRTASTGIVMAAFAAVGRCDERRLAELYNHEVEFRCPPALPYGWVFPTAAPPA